MVSTVVNIPRFMHTLMSEQNGSCLRRMIESTMRFLQWKACQRNLPRWRQLLHRKHP